MKITAMVSYANILAALDIESIDGLCCEPLDTFEIDNAEIDEDDLPECEICHGVEMEAVNSRLINDFVAAIKAGDTRTAQQLVSRVFPAPEDALVVDRALCRCAA